MRFKEPAQEWSKEFRELCGGDSQATSHKILRSIREARFSPSTASEAISVGDLVLLKDDSFAVHLVVDVPRSLAGLSYRYISDEGVVRFGSKKNIRLRFPAVVPPQYTSVLSSLVRLEKKHEGVAPIGIAEGTEKKRDDRKEDVAGAVGEVPEVSDSPISGSEASQVSATSDPEASQVSEVTTISADTDFLTALAMSNALVDTDIDTYHVPVSARAVYGEALREISRSALRSLNSASRKLQKVHRQLQGDAMTAPRTVLIFELLELVYGKEDSYRVGQVIAMVAALRKNVRLFNIDRHRAASTPATVTVIPAIRSRMVWEVVSWLKKGSHLLEVAQHYLGELGVAEPTPRPCYYDQTLELLRDYVIGNFGADYPAETALVGVVRLVDEALGHELGEVGYTYEYSRARTYQLLNDLAKARGTHLLANPILWSRAKKLPGGKASMMAEVTQEYYDYIDFVGAESTGGTSTGIESTSSADSEPTSKSAIISGVDDLLQHDRMSVVRTPFTEPIYCIDSPDAHEIDDGISIHVDGNDYVVTTHVANPSSYIQPGSTLDSVARSKGMTTYLPERAVLMLPQFVSKLAGLGVDGVPTRAFSVQFRFSKQHLDNGDAAAIYAQIQESVAVKSLTVSNFPQNYTYARVNEVLGDATKSAALAEHGSSGDVHFDNLSRLHRLAQLLKENRVARGDGLVFHVPRGVVKVADAPHVHAKSAVRAVENGHELDVGGTTKTIRISGNVAQSQDSKSQLLVSEIMVMANHAAALVAQQRGVGVVYRAQAMKLHEDVRKEIATIMGGGHNKLSEEQLSAILSVLTAAKMQVNPESHESIGLSSYINVTSPLRRYADILNHWKLEDCILRDAGIETQDSVPDANLAAIAEHLHNVGTVDKWAQLFSQKFWEGVFLKTYAEMFNEGKVSDPIPWRLSVGTSPAYGNLVRVDVSGFNNLRAFVEIDDKLKERFVGGLKVGDVLEGDVCISKVDFLEDELVFRYSTCK